MFMKMSGKGSSEHITELFICSFVGAVMQTVQIAPGDNITENKVSHESVLLFTERKVASTKHVPLPLRSMNLLHVLCMHIRCVLSVSGKARLPSETISVFTAANFREYCS